MSTPDPNAPATSAETAHQRRSREELEALAKSFVAAPTTDAGPAKPYVKYAMGAGVAAVLAVIVVLAWPKGQDPVRQQAAESASRAAAEAEAARQKYEAERERVRQQLASGQDYLERMAAADAELMKEMTERAEKLAQRAAAFAPEDTTPSPREEPARVAAAPKPAATAPANAPAPTASKPTAPAAAPPTQVASAAPAQATAKPDEGGEKCAIHVSELSASGKLTYEAVKQMKGARFDESTGNVLTPPVKTAGRPVVFEVFPNGCVRLRR